MHLVECGSVRGWRSEVSVEEFGGCSLLTGRLVWLSHSHFQNETCIADIRSTVNDMPFAERIDESNASAAVRQVIEMKLARA